MWELDHKEGWAPKNWCFWTVVLEKTLEIPLDCKEIQPVSPKGNQPWYSLEGMMLKLKLLNCDSGEDSSESFRQQDQPVNSKGNHSWMFIERTDAEAETPMLWPPDAKNWLTGKRLWCWERLKAGGEGGNRGWDGWVESLTLWTWIGANSGRQGSLVCSPWGRKEPDTI